MKKALYSGYFVVQIGWAVAVNRRRNA